MKSSKKIMEYLYFLYDSTGNDFKSEWINLNGFDALVPDGGKVLLGIFPCSHPGQIDSLGISMFGKSLICFPAFRITSFDG